MAAPRCLVDWPQVQVDVECSLCPRRGRYRLARLAERYGAAVPLTRLLELIAADCALMKPGEKPRQYEARCGVRYVVPPEGPLPADAPARAGAPRSDQPKPSGRTKRLGYDGPLPTIADTRAQNITTLRLCCRGLHRGTTCWHSAEMALDALGLPDDAAFVHIGELRRFRCARCGSTEVQVLPLWPDVRRKHEAAMGGDIRVPMPGTVREYRMPGLGERPTEQ